MHEDLVGYLLGALDADERQRVEAALAADATLRRELQRLRQLLQPLDALNDDQIPPSGLVNRTLDRIEQNTACTRSDPSTARVPAPVAATSFIRTFSVADSLVMGLVMLAAFILLFPALVNSRFEARKISCQDNLRQLGIQLITYSDRRADHTFPFVPLTGNRAFAGVFAPTLRDNLLIPADSSLLVCPGSDLATRGADWSVPSLQQIDQAAGHELILLCRRAAGSYAYSIGYFDQDGYRANRNLGRSYFALVGDTPSAYLPGRVSANHAGLGQNICFEDGHIEFVRDPHVMRSDDPLRNRLGYAEAGVDRDDAVVLPSGMRPVVGKPLAPAPGFGDPRRKETLRPVIVR